MPDPAAADRAPSTNRLTQYDVAHLTTCLRVLDASAAGADWREVTNAILGIVADREPHRARQCWDSHVRRARWMTANVIVNCCARDAVIGAIARDRLTRGLVAVGDSSTRSAGWPGPTAGGADMPSTVKRCGFVGRFVGQILESCLNH
jgi:hypothetical protein